MTPGILQPDQEDDHFLDRQLTRQMGCITGFFHLFDRHHPIPPKHKRLPSSPSVTSPPSLPSPPPPPSRSASPSVSSSDRSDGSPPLPPRASLPALDFRDAAGGAPWKLRDSPRLSLDSRVPREIRTVRSESDGSGDDRRSPSVVARLMGLDALPTPAPELRRSSSSTPRLSSPSTPPPPPAPSTPPPPLPPPPQGDFEMLREFLEAMQLKGLLRHRPDPIVVVRPARRREAAPDPRPRPREADRKPSRCAAQRGRSPPAVPRRGTGEEAARSPKPRRPRRISVAEDLSSAFDRERERLEYRNGRKLLDRCDKLLHSIAEITEGGGSGGGESGRQTSPVSVLDPSAAFYTVAESPPSPSPALKRCLQFEGRAGEKDDWRISSSLPILEPIDEAEAADRDFLYVSKVLHVVRRANGDGNAFFLLEKEHYHKTETSKALRLHRRLVFDSVVEIVDSKKRLPSSWETFARSQSPFAHMLPASPRQIWDELKSVQDQAFQTDDPCDVVSIVLQKDLLDREDKEGRSWSKQVVELSDVVLDVERLVFKDLVAETIRELAVSNPVRHWPAAYCSPIPVPVSSRRKLVF